ncbi:mediator of RNA polymerase II transcription subunit 15a isoform X1 [Vigna radiata var. radiata]|uniref:Mediator of RNA polymerase II transcription subunit 15a isoform X1 n=1 Tax=Vigna radiata var. radiata TaxID=3916 RepID=A0A1S3U104_VIGRR|nr:mediator of RNA polymerase II transcription subunit 15a isoform X1 [Vigna radiata var. radiata]
MDNNNWRPNQSNEANMDTSDWRGGLQQESRQRIVNKIMDTLKRHLPVSGQEGLHELQKIAQRFEEKIFTAATSQSDYLRKISLKMLTMETKSQGSMANAPNQGGPSNKPPDPGLVIPPQVHNPGQQHSIPMPNQSQARQQLMQNNIASQSSGLTQTPIQNVGQNNPNMQNIPGQNSVGNTISQNSNMQNMFAGSQRQIQARQQVVPQQQQQSQNSQQFLYQQQIQHQLIRQKFHQQQQQQQNLLQPNQLQSSQQPVIQTSSVMQQAPMMQTSLPSIQHNQQSNNVQQSTQSVLQQHSQVIRQQQPQQTSIIHQQQTPMTQQSILPPQQQQQQQLMGAQGNASNMQHTQILGTQSNNVSDLQQPQQRLLAQQNNLSNLQQQQLINQQNNLSNMHQQLGNNVPGLQPQQVLGPQSGNSGMQTSQHSAHVLQQSQVQIQSQSQPNASNLLPSQVQQSQTQAPQHQLMPQIQSQPAQLQQQLGLQQQPNSLQRDMQQRLQASGPLLQQSTVLDQQKQLYQSQRPLPETSSTSLDSTAQTGQSSGGDWQEEVYQKIKSMKESYLPELNEMYQKIASKLQQQDSLPQQPKSEQLDKLKVFKMMLERIITFLQVSKSNISLSPSFKEKLGSYGKQIINFINTNRPKKNIPGQLPPPHMHSMSQSQSQVTQVQSHENQINSQLQTSNMQGSVATMQQNNMPNMQHNSLSGVSTAQQSKMNSMQPNSNLDSGPGNAVNSLQQVPVSSLQQNPVSAPQQTNVNSLSSQSGVNVIQSNLNPLQQGSSMLQHQQLKQQEQQMLHNQQIKQQYQRQLIQRKQQQIMQQQQQQQLHQTAKQQLPAQLPTHQLQQLHQMNDANDIKMRQGIGVKPGVFQSHLTSSQRSSYPHQQMKGSPFPVSSPQLLQATSPQIPQHSSPQVDQQNHLPSLTKVATPLQSANSPFVVPTPSPPLAPSPMPGDSEKPISGVSLISNAANIGYQQSSGATAPAQSLAIGTPGISASPLLAEFTGPDGALGNAFVSTSGKSTVTEQPIERLIKAVKSMSSKTLCSAVSDIGSVVSMNDRIAGSAPGNGSRAAVGEDLVAMTNCRLQARNFIAQDGANGTRRMKRYTYATPLNVVSSAGSMNDSIKQLTASEVSDLDSTATSRFKMPRVEANHSLLEEIREVNQRLIDTVVDISNEEVDPTAAAAAAEGTEGTIVKCSYNAVALSPSLKSQYASVQMSPIQPLRLLVPTNYPNCSPILLDKFPVESGKENEDLSVKAKSRFSISLRSLSQPMSLGEIARTWDVCARTVISEHAQQSGGGSFSSKYGTWENCLTT